MTTLLTWSLTSPVFLMALTILSLPALILSWQRDLMRSRSGGLTGDFLYIACLMLVTLGELGTPRAEVELRRNTAEDRTED